MDFKSLKYYIAVAKYLNFTKAAKEFNITQTAISLSISKLEEELGIKLFERDRRNVILSAGGIAFLQEAKKLVASCDDAVAKAYQASLGYDGVLSIGFTDYPGATYITPVVQELHNRYPNILLSGNSNPKVNQPDCFRELNYDIALAIPQEYYHDSDFTTIPVVHKRLCLITPINHPLAERKRISLNDLDENEPLYVLAMRDTPYAQSYILTSMQKNGFAPKRVIPQQLFDDILFFVSAGLGVGLISPTLDFFPQQVARLELDESVELYADLSLVYLTRNQNPVLQLFLEVFKDMTVLQKLPFTV